MKVNGKLGSYRRLQRFQFQAEMSSKSRCYEGLNRVILGYTLILAKSMETMQGHTYPNEGEQHGQENEDEKQTGLTQACRDFVK